MPDQKQAIVTSDVPNQKQAIERLMRKVDGLLETAYSCIIIDNEKTVKLKENQVVHKNNSENLTHKIKNKEVHHFIGQSQSTNVQHELTGVIISHVQKDGQVHHVLKLDQTKNSLDEARDFFCQGIYAYSANDLQKAKKCLGEAESLIVTELNKNRHGKWLGITTTWVSFETRAYGFIPLIISIIFVFICAYMLGRFGESPNYPTLLSIPLWAPIVGGIGASVQILLGLHSDLRSFGIVPDYKQFAYSTLPIIGFIFGYLAYCMVDVGLIVLGQPQTGQIDPLRIGTLTPAVVSQIIVCFFAGFATEDFIKKLKKSQE